MVWDWSTYLADYGQPTSKYLRVNPSTALALLEKLVFLHALDFFITSAYLVVLFLRYLLKSCFINVKLGLLVHLICNVLLSWNAIMRQSQPRVGSNSFTACDVIAPVKQFSLEIPASASSV